MTSTLQTTYTFDVLAVATVTVTTDAGEDAARQAIDSLIAISTTAVPGELDVEIAPRGTVFDVRTVAPRGRGYLVDAISEDDKEVSVTTESIREPIDGADRNQLRAELDNANAALDGDSNDDEHDALYGLAQAVANVL